MIPGEFGRLLSRSAVLTLVRQPDAARAIFDRATGAVADMSDADVREHFAFISGFSEALVAVGFADLTASAALLRSTDNTADAMRAAVAAFLHSLTEEPS